MSLPSLLSSCNIYKDFHHVPPLPSFLQAIQIKLFISFLRRFVLETFHHTISHRDIGTPCAAVRDTCA
ncbi:hypothetical protein GDO78_005042 [Eleutherodactylus coqui]|uniref:Uncharacterized protein n=1 Tax=Eleutherodactylus coqui TaxID=57060 RepID=A0A8J6FLG5_ELECQ|nr:hypothetical protein GDO78_005042 [Eleutherodactylus coqui]